MEMSIKEIKKNVTKKTIDPYIYIPNFFCTYLVKLLLYTPITPNQLSLFLYLLHIPALLLIANNQNMIFAIIILHFILLLDCSDGVLARCKNQTSFLGSYFEYISHETIPAFMFLALSMYSYRILNNPIPLYLGGILITSILVIFSVGTSKQRMMYMYIKEKQKLPPKMLSSGQIRKDLRNQKSNIAIYDIIQVLSSLGFLTALITIAYIFKFLQYLIFFYTMYYLTIAIYKFIYELKT